MRAISYRRVSTREQSDSGLGLEAQTTALEAVIAARGWEHIADLHDVHTGRSANGRKRLRQALEMLEHGQADVLVVSKVDRVARSTVDFGKLLGRAKEQGWKLVVTDLGVDTSTATGKMVANVVAVLAEWEADMVSERTVAALAEVRKRGTRLGRPPEMDPKVRRRIIRMRERGMTLTAIASKLNTDGVPTARAGSRWHATTIARVVKSAA